MEGKGLHTHMSVSLCSTEGFLKGRTHLGGLKILTAVPFTSSGLWAILNLSGPSFLISVRANVGCMKIHELLYCTFVSLVERRYVENKEKQNSGSWPLRSCPYCWPLRKQSTLRRPQTQVPAGGLLPGPAGTFGEVLMMYDVSCT